VAARIPDSGSEDVHAAVKAAKATFPQWSKTSVQQRAAYLHEIADQMIQRAEEFVIAESEDQGKSLKDARLIDIPR
jgi:acyl-CoA reductase-like NAD-dependent aldehyde dehydrogenase